MSGAAPTLSLQEELDHEHIKTVRSISVSVNGGMIALGSFDATVSVLDKQGASYNCVTVLEGHENEVKSVEFHPHENILASCSRDSSVWLWDFDEELEFECLDTLTGHDEDVKMVRFVPDPSQPASKRLVSASYDNSVKVWEYTKEDQEFFCCQTLQDHSDTVWAIDFSKDGKLMFTCSADCSIKVYEKQSTEDSYRFDMVLSISGYHELPIYSIAYLSEEGLLASVGADDSLIVYKI